MRMIHWEGRRQEERREEGPEMGRREKGTREAEIRSGRRREEPRNQPLGCPLDALPILSVLRAVPSGNVTLTTKKGQAAKQ